MSLIRNWLTGIKIGEEIGAMFVTDLVRPKINKSWNRRSSWVPEAFAMESGL